MIQQFWLKKNNDSYPNKVDAQEELSFDKVTESRFKFKNPLLLHSVFPGIIFSPSF